MGNQIQNGILFTKLKIAHIDTERTWRGGENQAWLLMRGLRNQGHHNIAVARRGSAFAARCRESGFSVLELKPWGEWDFWAAHVVNRWLKKERVQILHAHTSHGLGLGAFASLGTGIPVVATRRVDFPLGSNPLSRWKYARAKKIVAISSGVRTVLINSGVPEHKIDLIPSGVDLSLHRTVQKLSRESMGIPAGPLIGQVAALALHKDQETFIEAFHLVKQNNPHAQAAIVGDGPLAAALKKKVADLGLSKSFHFLGFKPDPLSYLAAFDIFCLSSSEEGLGTSLIDAMALRVPVVATNVGGIPDLIEDGVTGFLASPKSPEQLATQIQVAFQVRNRNPELINRAEKKAQNFDIQNTVQRMESLYHSMI